MIGLATLVLVVTGSGSGLALAAEATRTHEAVFKPLSRAESVYAALGPAGPFYPQDAIVRDGKEPQVKVGDVVLECRTQANGTLNRCKILSSAPIRQFGFAAMSMAGRGRIGVEGVSEEQTVRVHVRFDLAIPVVVSR